MAGQPDRPISRERALVCNTTLAIGMLRHVRRRNTDSHESFCSSRALTCCGLALPWLPFMI